MKHLFDSRYARFALKVSALSLAVSYINLSAVVFADPIITTIAGTGEYGFSDGDGRAINAQFMRIGLKIDSEDNLYVIDDLACTVRKITQDGMISTVAGIPGQCGYSGDGGFATQAKLGNPNAIGNGGPNDITIDGHGNLYIADYGNQVIRIVYKQTGIIETYAGIPLNDTGLGGDSGPALTTRTSWVRGLGFKENTKELYFGGDEMRTIRKLVNNTIDNPSAGVISLFAGTGPCCGNDGATPSALSARFGSVNGIAFDKSYQNMYVSDHLANRIRKIDLSSLDNKVSTIAGEGCQYGYGNCSCTNDNDELAVTSPVNQPHGAVPDNLGNVYIVDTGSSRIRMINSSGMIKTVVGKCNTPSYSGDGGHPSLATLNAPGGIVFDSKGNYYVADSGNRRIRKVTINTDTTCANPATYDVNTGLVNLPAVDVPLLSPITGQPTEEFAVFSGRLKQLAGVDDFKIVNNSFNFIEIINQRNPAHAQYEYNDGIFLNGGKLKVCVSVPSVIVLPFEHSIISIVRNYLVSLRSLAIHPDVFHIETIQLANP